MGTAHKIHIGFHFHVDFFHSDKGDTNDDKGFGRDLSMVRSVLEILSKANNDGQPVKVAWDFETEYTLGRILPSLGPDVIEQVKTRLRERGDELLLSGTHADMFAGMTTRELRGAIRKSLTGTVYALPEAEKAKSKPASALGKSSAVLCPEKFAFSSGIIKDLKKCGVKAVILGNSAVGPDAMSTVSAELRKNPYSIYNPITYRHGDDSILLIPSYTPGDLLDAGSFTRFLTDLHNMQMTGEIDGDLFVLIGSDIRSHWWDSMEIKALFGTVQGTEGLTGFLKELRKLDYIAYNTPSGYLRDHEAAAECSFAGDVAAGYGSDLSAWGETPYDRLIWTRLERARNDCRVYSKERGSFSLAKRVELLSSHTFGQALPAPAKDRFAQAEALSEEIQKMERSAITKKEMSMRTSGRQRLNNSAIGKHSYSRRKDEEERNSFIIMNPQEQRIVTFQLEIEKGECPKITTLVLECDDCKIESYTAIDVETVDGYVVSAFVMMRFAETQNVYKIYYHFDRSDIPKAVHKPLIEIKEEDKPVFHAEGAMKRLLEAQGKLKQDKPAPNPTNPAVAKRIAEMNSMSSSGRSGAAPAHGIKETYVVQSTSKKLRVVINGAGANKGKVREVFFGDEHIGDDQFLMSFVKSGGKVSEFTCDNVKDVELSGAGEGASISGEIHAEGETSPGRYNFRFISSPVLKSFDGVLIFADLIYPGMPQADISSYNNDNDEKPEVKLLEEVAPLQISPLYRAGVSIIRRSFTGDVSDFPLSCFSKAVRENQTLASFNQQLTAGMVGIKGALSGIVIGNVRSMLGSMALCPGRLVTDGDGQHVSINPFGTYGLNDRKYPGISEGLLQTFSDLVVSGKKENIAMAYSGVHERFCLCMAGFSGASMHETQMSEFTAFADGAIVCGDDAGVIHPFEGDNVVVPAWQRELLPKDNFIPDQAKLKVLKGEISKFMSKKRKEGAKKDAH